MSSVFTTEERLKQLENGYRILMEAIDRLNEPTSKPECSCRVSPTANSDCPVHKEKTCTATGEDMKKAFHHNPIPPLNVQVAKALGDDVERMETFSGEILDKWGYVGYDKNGEKGFLDIENYDTDIALAMQVLEEYCKRKNLAYSIHKCPEKHLDYIIKFHSNRP